MATKKLIVVAHGIGQTPQDFDTAWAQAIAKKVDLANAEVRGLWWEDVLQEVEDKYPLVDGSLADAVAACGFADLQKWIDSDNYKTFHDYLMDVLVYVGLPDMWQHIQNVCLDKLDKLRRDENGKEVFAMGDTILIGHSLGAAMLPHLVWRDYSFTGSMAYRGLILLASPLAMVSPAPSICGDFLQRMGEISDGPDRNNVLRSFAAAWDVGEAGRLRFIANANDIVCSDVKYKLPITGQLVDLIPIRQGFNEDETKVLNDQHPGAVQVVSFGEPDPRQVLANHDVFAYFQQPAFATALTTLLQG